MTEQKAAQEIERRLRDGELGIAHRLHDQFEQEVIHQALDQEGIPFEIRLSTEYAFSFLFEPQLGHGVVLVATENVERTQTLIAQLLEADAAAAAAAKLEAEESVADEESPAG